MIRIGLGHDTHRLAEGGPLRLGGVDIPHAYHMVGHSDADVLMHAITDALLGAANLPDIGEWFPNNAEENKGRDSADFLRFANHKVNEEGWRITNIDTVIFAQEPKLSPYKGAMRTALAEVLMIDPQLIGIKSKTGEHVGPVGRKEAIQAECVVLLERIEEFI
ncbi:2-C-methyl-D-erythritol 2,4-cyclodiphosphate synthase [Blastopirellula marina]|uniref:2-C-methyl-D-erythritol 2,4-cyclodiphosphate synthase n=1 Tax=Blastopirellula marina TaxID=124 RepID=A0A2S8GFM0_9BACT|nr:2-C-methyl-D-erythritol 2,4-cyclodiphosphate synthase [Blastopirellula marina]PQO43255.1 2-C-methyl-D-erythritol 2,4-cyclodiphosphate synthase [Blastopirellula marina]